MRIYWFNLLSNEVVMFENMGLEELASEVMTVERMDTTKRLQLRRALAEYGIELQSEELITLSYKNYQYVLDDLNSMATVLSEEQLNAVREALIENELFYLVEKFVNDYLSGKYGKEDIERLHMVIDSKLPGEFSKISLTALVETAVHSAEHAFIESKINAIEKAGYDAMEAILIYYFSENGRSDADRKHVLTSFKEKALTSDHVGALSLIKTKVKALNARLFELELIGSEDDEIADLKKILLAAEKAETFFSPINEQPFSKAEVSPTASSQTAKTRLNDNEQSEYKGEGLLKRLVNGDIPLWKTYWLYGVLSGILFNVAYQIIPQTNGPVVAVMLINVVWTFFIVPGIWNSAGKYQGPAIWSTLARIAVVLGAISIGLSVFGVLALLT